MLDSIALDSTRLQRLQQRPLWDFALSFYSKPGVEAASLTLQDEAKVDVCELLFHCWLYTSGLEAMPDAVVTIREQRREWQQRVTDVLRALRRDLKPSAASSDAVTALRDTIKQAELKAERENLQRWQAWVFESSDSAQKVRNVTENALNSEMWLRKQLFIAEQDGGSEGDVKIPSGTLQAIQTLTCQLDPHRLAR